MCGGVFMFGSIVSEGKTNFKVLEENVFHMACDIANEIMKNILQDYDKQILETRDKARYRHKGYETTTLKTKIKRQV